MCESTPPLEPGLLALPPDAEAELPYLGKSEVIRCIVKGMQHGDSGPVRKLTDITQPTVPTHNYGEDITASIRTWEQWAMGLPLEPGDSRTLLIGCYTLMALEELTGMPRREVILTPMQEARNVEYSKILPSWSLKRLGSLSGKTTQFASMAILTQDRDPEEVFDYITSLPPHQRPMIEKSMRIKKEWLARRLLGKPFLFTEADRELTILRQTQALYTRLVTGKRPGLKAWHSEDAADLVMNGDLTIEEARELFPMLAHHESPRDTMIQVVMNQMVVDTNDHRLAMAALGSRNEPVWADTTERALAKTVPRYTTMLAKLHAYATGTEHAIARKDGINWLIAI